PAARIFPSDEDRVTASLFPTESIVLHPGSGSETKNWPIEHWIELGNHLVASGRQLLIVAGEADTARVVKLKSIWREQPARFAENLPLPHLAALLEARTFVGHDSGISHIAAAVGARCILLFGSTDPAVWAPANRSVTVLQAPEGQLARLEVETVFAATS
ncbi:MAG TPA: glycosyltransferase family 9 protein, partial [Chthoniobacterales bacterium]|nr:glycosyltransferase family 9 protein [Chthoniobacterales bacterium]